MTDVLVPLLAARARDLAEDLLAGLPQRWRHSIGVARRAGELAVTAGTGEDQDVLIAAAWLHDIGYAAPIAHTGFHPLDGARHLLRQGWPARIAALVAHHSGARFAAAAHGCADELNAFSRERGALSDALTYADQTTSATGAPADLEHRMAEMLRRHGPDSVNARIHAERGPHLRRVAARVEARLAAAGSGTPGRTG